MDMQGYEKIRDYINSYNSLAVIGTIDDDGTPRGAVVYICTDSHRPVVYFITKNGTHKYKNLIVRPSVSLTFVNPGEVSTLQAKGQASQVHDASTLDMITTRIARATTAAPEWLPPIAKIRAGKYVMIAVKLTEARLAQYKGRQIGEEDIFTEA